MMASRIAVIDGCRTPFLKVAGDYFDLMSYELAKFSIEGLLKKTNIDPKEIGTVILGTTISNIQTGNVAREAALTAGIPFSAPCHTVTMACISANQAIVNAVHALQSGFTEVAIAGGVDCVSDVPIIFNKAMRKKIIRAQKIKGFSEILKFGLSLKIKDFKPEAPAVEEFLTKRTMGLDCDILSKRFGVTRKEQDEFAVRSHVLSAKADAAGILEKDIIPVQANGKTVIKDNGFRGNSTVERMARLKPAFVKDGSGTVTAGNASFLTDGAATVLLMTEEKALALGYKPKAFIHSFTFTGQDLETDLLLGPTFAISKLLAQQNLTFADIDVFEFHEAFAGQMVANMKCLKSDEFAKTKLGREKALGEVPLDKLNLWGGSLALGHPFGATGARLVNTAANRLIAENGCYALISACAAGAHGHAMILERA